jgi:hypothetical protein
VFADADRSPLVSYDAAELDGRIMHADTQPGSESRRARAIDPGRRALLHVWIDIHIGWCSLTTKARSSS